MARQIYSFTKIEKKKTNAGIVTAVMGGLTIAALAALVVAAVILKGTLPEGIASLGLISFVVAVGSLMTAGTARKDDDSFGRFLNTGYIISAVSVGLHVLVFLTGILAIIM